MKPSIDKSSKEEKGGAWLGRGIITRLQAWHMPRVNTYVRGHGRTDRHDEWPKVPTRRHAYKLACRERKVMCGQPPSRHCNTENPIHTLHRPSISHHYLSQQWHCSIIRVCMWLGECAYTVHLCICSVHTLLSAYTYVNVISKQCKWTQCRSVEYVNMLFLACMCISECEFGCVRVQAPQRDQWVGTWPCQYSWSLSV